MLNMKIDCMVGQIVRQELRDSGREDEGLYMNLDCRLSYYMPEGSYNESCGLHLIYQCNPGYASINVFSGVTDSPFASSKDVPSWKHECSHDSCWRDIGVFSEVYFKMAEKINQALLKDGLEQVAPKDMHESNSFNGFDKVFRWKKVKITKDPTDRNNYRKLLELL